jgi:molecular chaperone DnaK
MLVADAREHLKQGTGAPLDRVRSLTSELQQIFHGLAAESTSSSSSPGQGSSADDTASDDDVIDADFTVS